MRRMLLAALAAAHTAVAMANLSGADFGGLAGVPDKDFTTGIFLRSAFPRADFTLAERLPPSGPGGAVRVVDADSAPLLGTVPLAAAQVIYNFQPCGFVVPSVHPASSQTVTSLVGELEVGFVDEVGVLHEGVALTQPRSFFIPQGLVSYIANPSCETSFAIGAFSTPDAGAAQTFASFMALPAKIIAAVAPALTAASAPAGPPATGMPFLDIDPACAARCGLDT